MPEVTDSPTYPIVIFAGKYSGDIMRATILQETNEREIMWRIKIRPHHPMRHYCSHIIEKIPLNDIKRRDGDCVIFNYPMRLRRSIDTDPNHTVWWLWCDLEGKEIFNLGSPDEQFAFQLKEAQNRIIQLKKELAKKDKIMFDMSNKYDFEESINQNIRNTLSQEMRALQMQIKERDIMSSRP